MGIDADARDKLIVALDFPARAPAMAMVERLEGAVRWYKVGLELYLTEGRGFVEELRSLGFDVFLDLKLHDIPNTVAGAVRSAASAGAGLLTVHTSGGPAMLLAAAEAAAAVNAAPKLLGVTVLTSMDAAQLAAVGVASEPREQAVQLGEMAMTCGVDGLVCSPEEITALRGSRAAAAQLVVPGIRSDRDAPDDQSRTASAFDAVRYGADRIVVGRPITRAASPPDAASGILAEIERAMGG